MKVHELSLHNADRPLLRYLDREIGYNLERANPVRKCHSERSEESGAGSAEGLPIHPASLERCDELLIIAARLDQADRRSMIGV